MKELDTEADDQPTPEGQTIPDDSTALEGSFTPDNPFTKDQSTPDAPSF